MKTAFIYSDSFSDFDYGTSHPLRTFRLKLTYELIKAYGLHSHPDLKFFEAEPARDEDLLMFHQKDYLDVLNAVNSGAPVAAAAAYGLGPGDNPVFKGLLDWSRLVTGASLQAASLVESGEAEIAFSIAGGLHHARSSQASGFCYVNDPVIAIMSLLKKRRSVAYIDIDAHHGDGVQEAFYDTDEVLTISIHETGRMLFPGIGFEHEIGRDRGLGYSVNVPLPPYADDEMFEQAFDEIVTPLIGKFQPDVVVTQLGVDSFISDPLAHLNYTTNGFCSILKKIKKISPKWVALGGGGYDISNVARAWTLAWAVMNDIEVPDEIPADFLQDYAPKGFRGRSLRDKPHKETGHGKEMMQQDLQRIIGFLRETVFPLIQPSR